MSADCVPWTSLGKRRPVPVKIVGESGQPELVQSAATDFRPSAVASVGTVNLSGATNRRSMGGIRSFQRHEVLEREGQYGGTEYRAVFHVDGVVSCYRPSRLQQSGCVSPTGATIHHALLLDGVILRC